MDDYLGSYKNTDLAKETVTSQSSYQKEDLE